tara:strand:+ start:908 stop:1489 length:582 start_codon:yes stop_codon:yes gene_type:complete
MEPIKNPKKLNLHKALQIGYIRDEVKQKKRLKRFGYRLVPDLTTREHLVAINPTNNKLLYISNGTDFGNSNDLQNDIVGAFGAQRDSKRMKEEKNALLKAKQTLKPSDVTLVSHSLGSQYTNYIASPEDRVIQANPFYTAGAKSRANVQNFRTSNDLVSTFSPKENTTIVKTNKINPITTHNIDSFKNVPIYI